ADKANTLRDFAEKLASLLDIAYPQAEAKLRKLLVALEGNNVKVELGPRAKKTLHVTPEGERWYVSAHMVEDKRWLISLPIYRVSAEAEFPDILGLNSETLYYLQAGWRASDELDVMGKPGITTTQPWQVLAWVAVRNGYLRIYLNALNLNMNEPTLAWSITSKSWEQQWPTREGKKLAKHVAKRHPLGMLSWYLGDGKRHRFILKYSIEGNEKYESRELVQQMIQVAYQTGYGKLLDLLTCDKWKALKRLQLKQHPVYATYQGYTFWLNYHEKEDVVRARTIAYTFEEAEAISQSLRRLGIQHISISIVKNKWKRYYYVGFHTSEVVKLAEKYSQWREAIKKLVAMHDIKPRGPITRRLLELAENPPLLAQKI
ncbi:MAG: hypothetical protein LM565_04745, partial [Thermofilum sp.]|nr:hypothetical protein [Thermofilum sp.]